LFGAEPGMQDSQKQGLQLLALAQAKSLTTSRKVETSYKLHLHLLKVSSQLHVLLLREHVEMQYNIVSILMLSVICNLQIMMCAVILSFSGGSYPTLGYEIVLFWSHVEFCLVAANAKVLAAELPKHDERDSQVLYPASLKASNDLGMKVMMFTIC